MPSPCPTPSKSDAFSNYLQFDRKKSYGTPTNAVGKTESDHAIF
jgi:hypothetical protein